MAEDRLWEWLHPRLPRGQYTRIESGDTGPGFPDVHYQIRPGVSGTIELKDARHPRSARPFTDEHGIRPSQIRWITDNLQCGGTVWIFARVGSRTFMIPGFYCRAINNASTSDLEAMSVAVLPARGGESTWRKVQRLIAKMEKNT